MARCLSQFFHELSAKVARGLHSLLRQTYRIDLSTRHTMKTPDWSGRVEISGGKIVQVRKTSGSFDTIPLDMSWTIVYGRSLAGRPKDQPGAKAILISVEAPGDVKPGRAYYYVRVMQRDPAKPDGDPQIAWTSPIFVEYR